MSIEAYRKKYPKAKPKLLRPWIWNTPYGIDPHPLLNMGSFPFVNSYNGQSSYPSQQ